MSKDKLVGKLSVPLDESTERIVLTLSKRYGISKAEASRMLIREGGKVLSKRKRLVIFPTK